MKREKKERILISTQTILLILALLFLFISCTQQKPQAAQSIVAPPQTHPCFQTRANQYTADYALTITGKETREGNMTVAANNFLPQETTYAQIVTTTTLKTAGKEQQFALYLLTEKGYYCTEQQQQWNCNELPPQQVRAAQRAPGSQVQLEQHPDQYHVKQTETRTLLDEQVSCCEATLAPTPQTTITLEYCYTTDGIPLSIKTQAGEITSHLLATTVQRTTKPTAFHVPSISS